MYKISETENCYELLVYDDELEDGTAVLIISGADSQEVGLDKEQSTKLIKKLEAFINEHP